jgi:Primase C terminal 2 (PriCT-2)
MTQIDLDEAYRVLAEAAVARGLASYGDDRPTRSTEKLARNPEDVEMWLAGIPNPKPEAAGVSVFDWRNTVGMSVYGATGGSEEGLQLFLQWSAKDPAFNAEWHQAKVRGRWQHYHRCPPTDLGAGKLAWLHQQFHVDDYDEEGDGGEQ